MERKVLSIFEASELVGVSRRTIHSWIAAGKIGYSRTAGGSIRIFSDTLWREPHASAHPVAPGHPTSSNHVWLT
jgi:excisionase family DNA binding protein